ncbi:MAG: hypothetical protein ACRCTA_07695, partial [Bacilli bacterium]
KNKNNKVTNTTLLFVISIIPVGFLMLRLLIFPLLSGTKYSLYTGNMGVFDLPMAASTIVLGVFFIFFYRKQKTQDSNMWLYIVLYVMKLVVEIFSPLLGSGRIAWFFNGSLSFIFAYVIISNTKALDRFLVSLLITIYCIYYCLNAYFTSSMLGKYIVPYQTHFTYEERVVQ